MKLFICLFFHKVKIFIIIIVLINVLKNVIFLLVFRRKCMKNLSMSKADSNDVIGDFKISSASINIERIKAKQLSEDVGSAQSYFTSKFTQNSLNINESSLQLDKPFRSEISIPNYVVKEANSNVNKEAFLNYNISSIVIEAKDEKMIHLFNQSLINKIVLTKSTFKYGFIMIASILLIFFLLFIFILGAVNIDNCPLSPNIPVYLLLMGFMSSLRIILFYTCPFSYSKSVAGKLNKNLSFILILYYLFIFISVR